MKSKVVFKKINNIKYHIRIWGNEVDQPLVLLHGWMDISASFKYFVESLKNKYYIISPDWRGFGKSGWSTNGYWFPDYFSDLDEIINKFIPKRKLILLGHSMGGNIAAIYSGIKPRKIKKLILVEGFGLPSLSPKSAPFKLDKWLSMKQSKQKFSKYDTFNDVALRLISNSPKLCLKRANYLARNWAKKNHEGEIELRSDPSHKIINPYVYRLDDSIECWKKITAPTLWLESDGTWLKNFMKKSIIDIKFYKKSYKNLVERKIKSCGHMIHLEEPKKLAEIFEKFIGNAI